VVDEPVSDPFAMGSTKASQELGAGGREACLDTARVAAGPLALNEPLTLQPLDPPGDATRAEQHLIRKVAHPQPPTWGGGEVDQNVEIANPHAVRFLELSVELAHQARMGEEKRLPRLEPEILAGRHGARGGRGLHRIAV
jgi:hypothetical protein